MITKGFNKATALDLFSLKKNEIATLDESRRRKINIFNIYNVF